jgi:hypothetical protein
MKAYFNTTENEERRLFDTVLLELLKRSLEGRYEGPRPNYNELEDARRLAISHGAYRTDNYFDK